MRHSARTSRLVAGFLCVLLLASLVEAALSASYPYDTRCLDNVNLRKSASANATVLMRIKAGSSVTVVGVSGQYYKLDAGGMKGYALKKYVDGLSDSPDGMPSVISALPPPGGVSTYPYDTNTIDSVKLRKTAEPSGEVLLRIPRDDVVLVLELTSNGFAKVKYSGKTGYAKSDFINLANIPAPTPVPTPTPPPGAEKYTELKKGSTGVMVKTLQEALTELGFYEGAVDSKFGDQTAQAVTTFQKRNGLDQTGIITPAIQVLLYEGTPKNTIGYRKILKTLPPVPGAIIRAGSVGEPVKALQERLKVLGFYIGESTGTSDKATVQSIKDFQKLHGLDPTGEADLETQNRMYGATALSAGTVVTPTPLPTLAPPKGTVREGDKGDDVKTVQQRLKDLGYYTGKIDGKFESGTVKALKAFQKKGGLKQDGVCGTITRAALFGVNAPYAKATAIPLTATVAPFNPANVVIIQSGARGNDVMNLQRRLMELGYYASRLDGVYLEDDITAVRAFQKANGLKVDGKAGLETQTRLFGEEAIRGSAITTPGVTLRYGSAGNDVVALQNRLIELGYLTGSADGKFGMATKTALIAFQKANNLVRDGKAGAKTQAALTASVVVAKKVDASSTLKQGAVSAAVKDLQLRLISLGYLSSAADGKFGSATSLALIAFQNRNSLTADGIAGAKTLAALNSNSARPSLDAVATPKPGALLLTNAPSAANVRYANWYTEVKAHCKQYPNVTVYDFVTGLNWQMNIFSTGAHADAEPLTSNDTANMNRAFGGKTTWTPKAVWVVFSDGRVYLASTHNTPHDPYHIRTNDFNGHVCIHFPREMEQVEAIGPYATSHQKSIDLGWVATQRLAGI